MTMTVSAKYYDSTEFLGLDSPNNQSIDSFTSIRLVRTRADLMEIYRFRYRIYVEEMRLTQFYADHNAGTIEDPLDTSAYNFAAFQKNEVIGVLRFNFSRDRSLLYYEDFLNMRSVGDFHPERTSISTRLMVMPRFRGTNLALRLAQVGYIFGLSHNIRFNFIDCNDNLSRFFERLGYIFQGKAGHPEYGIGNVMRLDLLDRAHLTAICSPLLAGLSALPRPDWSHR